MNPKIKKQIQALLEKIAETEEHRRLIAELDRFARSIGYDKTLSGIGNGRPDVVKYLKDPDGIYLFVGDAKNAENERATHQAVYDRINSYVGIISENLKLMSGCIVTIATNNKQAAEEWKDALEEMFADNNLVCADGTTYQFSIVKWNTRTWIIAPKI